MKIIALILLQLFLIPTMAQAKCFNLYPISEVERAIADPEIQDFRAKCDPKVEKCVCFDGMRWETVKLEDVQKDDYSKPKYAEKKQVQACSTKLECFALIKNKVQAPHPQAGQPILDKDDNPVLDADGNPKKYAASITQDYCTDYGYYPVVAEGFTEVYCTKHMGWHKKTVKQLAVDAAKKAAFDAKLAARNNEQKQKRNKRKNRMVALKNCAKNFDGLKPAQQKACQKAMLKELLKSELKPSEM